MVKPPRVAEIGRFIPPTTTPASTKIVSERPNVLVIWNCATLSKTAAIAANSAEMTTAPVMTRLARTPRS